MAVSLKTQKSIKYKLKRFLFDIKNTMKNKSFSFWILIINGVIVIFVFLIPILLRFDLVKKFVSYYFMSFPNLDYKVAYIALLGGLVGTIISITGALAVQNIFSKKELEKEKIQKKAKEAGMTEMEYLDGMIADIKKCIWKYRIYYFGIISSERNTKRTQFRKI